MNLMTYAYQLDPKHGSIHLSLYDETGVEINPYKKLFIKSIKNQLDKQRSHPFDFFF